jgi:hypothetical protein
MTLVRRKHDNGYLTFLTLNKFYLYNMKKAIILLTASVFLLNGCFISRIFHKQEKYGCPTNGRNVGAEKIVSGDKKAIAAEKKAKYKGGRKYYKE